MDSYKTTVLTLLMATALGVGAAFFLTSSSDVRPQYGQWQSFQAPDVAPLDCTQFRGALAERDCQALNQHFRMAPRDRQIYNATTQAVQRLKQSGGAPAPSPQAAYALAQQMGVYQQDAPLVYQAMLDEYKRGILVEQREQILSELQTAPTR